MKANLILPFRVLPGERIVFFTPSMVALALFVMMGLLLGFGMSHGLVHPYDKGIHFVFFAGFMFFAATSINRLSNSLAALIFSLAVGSEFLQIFIPERHFSAGDMAANGVGCLAGIALVTRYRKEFMDFCIRSPFFKD